MRALVLHWGRTGGGPRFAAESVLALHEAGVWTASSWSRQSEQAGRHPGPADAAFPIDTFTSAPQSILRSPTAVVAAVRLRRFVVRARIDCVFAAMEQIWQPAAAQILRRSTVPYLLGLHDASFHPGDGSRLQALTRRAEISGADGLITFSEQVREDANRAGLMPEPRVWSTFLPAVALPQSRRDEAGRCAVRIGFFGRWQAYKGLALLVEAVGMLRGRTSVPFEVHVHGDGDGLGLAGAEAVGIAVHRGWTPEHELENTIAGFDVLVAPYIEASQSGVVPLAAALGVPAVVTPVGGLTEQVEDGVTGIVAETVGADALCSTLMRIIADPELRGRLGQAAKRRAEEARSITRFGAELRTAMEELTTMGKRR